MNWKDYPHLFCNGKFHVGLTGFINLKIEMYDAIGNMYCLSDVIGWQRVSDCTLIARPISDMTDEECEKLFNYQRFSEPMKGAFSSIAKKEMAIKSYRRDMYAKSFVYLLSIGVYPFDDDKDVIYK